MIRTINPGAYIKFKFTGTSLAITYDPGDWGALAAKKWPRLAWSIDGGAWQTQQLTSADGGRVQIASGLSSGLHSVTIYSLSMDAYTSRWDTDMSLALRKIILDAGATLSAPTERSGTMLAYGNSITEGAWALGDSDDLDNYSLYQDGRRSYVQIVAESLDCELGCVAFGGQRWNAAWNGDIPAFPDSWDWIYGGVGRLSGGLFDPVPDWLLCNMGTNGTVLDTDVQDWLGAARAAAGAACKIALIIQKDTNATELQSGFDLYQTATPDANCKCINLNNPDIDETDGLHPSIIGHQELAQLVLDALDASF